MAKVINKAGTATFKLASRIMSTGGQVIYKKKDFRKHKFLHLVAVLSGLGLFFTIVGSILVIFVFTAFSSTLPSPSKLTNRAIEQSTRIYDRSGFLLYQVFDSKNRTLVPLSQISPNLLNATLAAEDADFYEHEGIDPISIARSVFITITQKGTQGGSTITQQVAKNALLTSERTVVRKVKDIVLALQIENTYTKDEILQMYLNEVPYGGTTWGAESAAETYFGKSASNLTIAQAALLAGLPQRPSYYSPHRDPTAAKERQKYVLHLMYTRGWIGPDKVKRNLSKEEYEGALAEELNYSESKTLLNAPHFVMYVIDQIKRRYGEDVVDKEGLSVTTSLDLNLQNEYQTYLRDEVTKASKNLKLTNGGLVAIDPKTRQILAMVGSKEYFATDIDGQFNVTLGMRQPGSALKPFTYLTGLTQGYTASTVLYDVKTKFDRGENLKPYEPDNYGGWGFRGPMQVRYTLANSVNVPAVKMLDLVGIQNMVNLANSLGIKSLQYNPSIHGLALTLGGGAVNLLELTNGYSSIADGGKYREPVAILEIKDSTGKVIERHTDNPAKQVVDERLAWIITDILSDNSARSAAFGTRSELYIPKNKVAVKTGTSNDLKDNWTIGFTKDITIGVWVGNNDGTAMNTRLASGTTGAAPIWNKAIQYYLKDHPNEEFVKPEDIKEEWVGTLSGMIPYENKEERRLEYFLEGTEPKTKSSIFQRVKVCDDGDVEDKLYTVYQAERPEWQEYLNAWIDSKYKDDDDERFKYRGPEYEKEKKPDKFDIDNCEEDNNN